MKVVRDSIIYLGSSVINKLIPFILLPITTSFLSPEDFGKYSIYYLFVTIYLAIIGMGINTNISKNFFSKSKEELALIVGNIMIVLFTAFIIIFGITLTLSFTNNSLFSLPSKWIVLVPIISLMMMMNTINLTILRNESKAIMYGVFEISNTLINVSISIILIVLFKYKWEAQVIGLTTAYFIFFIISIIYLNRKKYIRFIYDKTITNSILKLSLPLIPHTLGNVIITLSDRLFIEKLVDTSSVGLYSVGYSFGMIVNVVTDAFIKAWSPWFFKKINKSPNPEEKRSIVKFTYLFIVIIFIIAILISLVATNIFPYFVDSKYLRAKEFIIWVSIGYAVNAIYKIFFLYLVHLNKTSFLAFSTFMSAIINLILNYYLIKIFGAIGAAYSTLLAYLVSSTLVFFYVKSKMDMPWFKLNLMKLK